TFDQRPALFGEKINEHESEIMSRPLILAARVAKADDEPLLFHAMLAFGAPVALTFSRSFADYFRFGTSLELWFEFGFLDDRDHRDHGVGTLMDLDSLTNF